MRILHIQDFGPLAFQTAALLKTMVVSVDSVGSIACAADALEANKYDLTIWDVDAVSPEAIDKLPDLRARSPKTQVLICGSNETIQIVVAAIEKGADDFILRPVRPDELRIRIQQASARAPDLSNGRESSEFGPLRIDITQGDVSVDGVSLNLTPRERSVLHVLMRARGNVVSKDQIAARVFSLNEDADPQSIETYVHRLRRKVDHPAFTIETLRGLGYRLTATNKA
ncbi:response regulator transcription factor [Filomicrobium sp.]|uniref:response regulator transcription factor n=1 Tax=Filomicrobium sp. TaxID=2024831 RepID=UPI00258EF029|nr:response regulator transcription factor [Filomicrobium sp.]MCV0368094.1 response regulator transcription factor [Filomicrobium sp.]